MAKLGWAFFGILALAAAGMAASRPVDDHGAKLEEIRALLAENNRLQRLEVHPRLYQHHPIFPVCDFGKNCDVYDVRARSHVLDLEPAEHHHDFGPECIDRAVCKQREAELQRRVAEVKERQKKK